jgi:glycosyltransferase involved in cell wall biosynthesis
MVRRMRIILLSGSDFEIGRGLHIAKILKSQGADLVIITNEPVYLRSSEVGKEERKFGVRVLRFKLPFAKALHFSILGRLMFYILFMFETFIRSLRFISYVNVIYSRGPHPFTDIVSILLKKIRKRIIVISDVTDLWPESLLFANKSPYARLTIKIGMIVNKWVYPKVDVIITHNYPFKKYIERVYLSGRMSTPIVIIPHLIDLSEFRPMNKDEALSMLEKMCGTVPELKEKLRNRIVLGYVGLISKTIGSDILLRLFEELKDDEKFVFFVVGEGPLKQEMIHIVKSRNMNNVIFAGPFPHDLMKYVINVFDIALITSFQDPRHFSTRYCLPKKFVEYSACGKPIIYIGPSRVLFHYIKKYNSGFVIENIHDISIKDTLYKILINIHKFAENSRKMSQCFSYNLAKKELGKLLAG